MSIIRAKSFTARFGFVVAAVLAVIVLAFGAPFSAASSRAFADDEVKVTTITGNTDQYSDDGEAALRNSEGVVSQLSTTTHNPYNKLITVRIDIGAEFAEYEGGNITEAIVVKCRPGDYIELPKVKARDGYTFIGWNQGGVSEPLWTPDVTTVQMTDDANGGKSTVIDAIYMDDEGNGYCTCGAWVQGYFKNNMQHYKDVYANYLKNTGGTIQGTSKTQGSLASMLLPFFAGVLLAAIAALIIIVIVRKPSASRSATKAAATNLETPSYHGVSEDEQLVSYDSMHPDLRPAVDFVAAIEAASQQARARESD